jgi:cytochrome c
MSRAASWTCRLGAAAIAASAALCSVKVLGNELGRRLFEPCRACHALDVDAPPMAGPNLSGLMGRTVAGDPKFDYSPVLRTARATGRVWDHKLLDQFLRDPEAMFPGMWMTSRPMPDAAERRALADFLADPKSR